MTNSPTPLAICWMRRDLRLHDNTALHAALSSGIPVLPVFMFDRNILDALADRSDRRVAFIHQHLGQIRAQLQPHSSSLWTCYGAPETEWPRLFNQLEAAGYAVQAVHTNRDYEPYALQRDAAVRELLAARGVAWHDYKDHVIFEPHEVLKADGTPYTVFTPYSKRWLAHDPATVVAQRYPSETLLDRLAPLPNAPWFTLEDMGFSTPQDAAFPPINMDAAQLAAYAETRDLPAVPGTTRLSVHLRFGTVSIREAVAQGLQHSTKWLMELVWRDFYQAILHHFPHSVDGAFKPAYDHIAWEPPGPEFEAWKAGRTGYPLVDAGMRELAATGFMHNRVRMVVASFLCKHLLLDWRLGERWFAAHLLDFELASNVGGWQWAAGSGCDAAPYFRVFNPTAQQQKFDPDFAYVRRWVPEFGTSAYPEPVVEHKFARARAIDRYQQALKPNQAQPKLF